MQQHSTLCFSSANALRNYALPFPQYYACIQKYTVDSYFFSKCVCVWELFPALKKDATVVFCVRQLFEVQGALVKVNFQPHIGLITGAELGAV